MSDVPPSLPIEQVLPLVEQAAEAAVHRALIQTIVPVFRQGFVTVANQSTWIHQVQMDGDADSILAMDISAGGAFVGARVTVMFTPPHQAQIVAVHRSQIGWQPYPVQWTCPAGIAPVVADGFLLGAYQRDGQSCDLNIVLLFGPTTGGGSNLWRFSLPFPAASDVSEQVMLCKAFTNGDVSWIGAAPIASNATTFDPLFPQSNSAVSMINARNTDGSAMVGTGIPVIPLQFTWTNGRNFVVTGRYKVAP